MLVRNDTTSLQQIDPSYLCLAAPQTSILHLRPSLPSNGRKAPGTSTCPAFCLQQAVSPAETLRLKVLTRHSAAAVGVKLGGPGAGRRTFPNKKNNEKGAEQNALSGLCWSSEKKETDVSKDGQKRLQANAIREGLREIHMNMKATVPACAIGVCIQSAYAACIRVLNPSFCCLQALILLSPPDSLTYVLLTRAQP